MEHRFQINLRGIIDLLSNHLYSSPRVFLRELLQNGVDALQARQKLDPAHKGSINIEVIPATGSTPPTLVFEDNGIGLNEEEIHRFLATIGESSKRGALGERSDFIGQFGIGLLTCFVVSDEITVITRSARGGSPALEWKGRSDGSYAVRELDRDLEPGTRVYLRAQPERLEYFEFELVRDLVNHYGGLLPWPISVRCGAQSSQINIDALPWQIKYTTQKEQRDALLEYGRKIFETDFFDAIPLKAKAGKIEGVAFVMPQTLNLAARPQHRVYLKRMLLTESSDEMLPEWAFFIRAVVNVEGLRPLASREGFSEDPLLADAREELGENLQKYLKDMATFEPERMERFIMLHYRAIKALAVENDEIYKLFIHALPFETSKGFITLGQFLRGEKSIRYVARVDEFRQVEKVVKAQGMGLINAGYTNDEFLLSVYNQFFSNVDVEKLEPGDLAQNFQELTLDERDRTDDFIQSADAALRSFRCRAVLRRFSPTEIPAMYTVPESLRLERQREDTRKAAPPHLGGILQSMGGFRAPSEMAQLCFNYAHPLVVQLCGLKNKTLTEKLVRMLYVQSLLMGHHALSSGELKLLGEGLSDLLNLALRGGGAAHE